VRPSHNRLLVLTVLAAVIAVVAAILAAHAMRPKPPLGVFATLPVYWRETSELGDLLAADGTMPWPRRVLERDYTLRPLDVLAGGGRGDPLADLPHLLMAQPRALSAVENVALDAWVRRGGRLLLFADPMLTAHSTFAVGDRRRPQDVVLLSPILRHWGLDLRFDEGQPAGERQATVFGAAIPLDLAGHFVLLPPGKAAGMCTLHAQGVAAECAIGKGKVLVLADAALLDGQVADGQREAALSRLAAQAFAAD
jgi:hypothetical protein